MSDNWDISKRKNSGLKKEVERAVVIGLILPDSSAEQMSEYLDELEFLAETAGATTVKRFTQKLPHPNKSTFIGKGKVAEIKEYIETHDIALAIFDDDLTPRQTSVMEEEWKVKIIDRSFLILDIFASRARSAQAKTQVELAQMQYLLPRLRGLWTHLERQKGGIGMRGPGEMEIETDRRIVRDKVSKLKDKLKKIDLQNTTQRKNRGELIRVSLVGYTNAGKSTLMNILSKSDVFAENKLFATLDTTVRKMVLDRMPLLLSDTVGFIRKLPHHLVESFKSTLDEVRESDILLHVVDISHGQYEDHIATVTKTLKSLGAIEKPTLLVFNKIDLYREKYFDDFLDTETRDDILSKLKMTLANDHNLEVVLISAFKKENISELRAKIKEMAEKKYEERYPYMTKHW
jgi:GTP-binding protein HflX